MSYEYSEDAAVETPAVEKLEELGWTIETAWTHETFGENGLLGRAAKKEVVLTRYLKAALMRLNPNLPDSAYKSAIDKLIEKSVDKTLGQINHDKHKLITQGVPVEFKDAKGVLQKKRLKVIDFNQASNNHFLAVRQFEVDGEVYKNKRPDVVGFINGLPMVFFEFKSPSVNIVNAYNDNLKDYKDTITHLFHHNAFIILSNGVESKVGTITSPFKFFLDWKRIDEDSEGVVSLETMLMGTCEPSRLLDIIENFVLFDSSGGEVVKIMAKNHQFIGVNRVIDQTKNIEELKGKLGVFWHTQGSGKSYSMVFLAEKIHRKFGGAFTFLIVVDRSELENQLYDTFTSVGAVTEKNVKAESREHLRTLLADNHRYVFTLIHKFSIDPKKEQQFPLITERKNIIVISDEAHRTQGGTFAQNMRYHALPNASFLGFTGTPIIKEEEELTAKIFGGYVSVYNFKRAIEDEATLPLKYINRGEKLGIDNPDLDKQMAAIVDNEELDSDQKEKLERLFAKSYPILTAEPRLDAIAKDLVWHFNERGYQGKAMLVTLDKPTAVRMYNLIMTHWADYLDELEKRILKAEDDQEALQLRLKLSRTRNTEVCVVVSSEQNEVDKFKQYGLDIEYHRKKMVTRDLEKEFKDANNPFRLAIVCAMWITGFDAPCVSTVYLDKPIKGHTLMQTIARANRVYTDEKENGLIVDYGNVYKNLEKAYSVYGEGGKSATGETGDNTAKPAEKLIEMTAELATAIEGVKECLMELSFNLDSLVQATGLEKLAQLEKAANAVKFNDTTKTTFEFKAREVFRKYNALFPEAEAKPYTKDTNAIQAIYDRLNQKVKSADVISVIRKLQAIVGDNIKIIPDSSQDVEVDLSKLNYEALRKAFEKASNKNEVVFDLQKAIEQKIQAMANQNPTRAKFHELYVEIIKEYNQAKDAAAIAKTFAKVENLLQLLSDEEKRAVREELDEPTLAIFDLLLKPELSKSERKQVKQVAVETLKAIEAKVTSPNFRVSAQINADVKTNIIINLVKLKTEAAYSDEEVIERSEAVYEFLFSHAKSWQGQSVGGHQSTAING